MVPKGYVFKATATIMTSHNRGKRNNRVGQETVISEFFLFSPRMLGWFFGFVFHLPSWPGTKFPRQALKHPWRWFIITAISPTVSFRKQFYCAGACIQNHKSPAQTRAEIGGKYVEFFTPLCPTVDWLRLCFSHHERDELSACVRKTYEDSEGVKRRDLGQRTNINV